jgi:hypothetical protein
MHSGFGPARSHELLQRADVSFEVHARASQSSALLDELHAMANAMSVESREHFGVHAAAMDTVHLFRARATGAVVGFQFWGARPAQEAATRVILGGKLRISPAYRRRGLHLLSGLTFYREQLAAFPDVRLVRVSLCNLFGFMALARALERYDFVSEARLAPDDRWLCDVVASLAAESHFRFDRESALVDVRIFVSEAQLARYPAAFYETPLAREYIARNPDFRKNGAYLALWFPLTPDNLASIESELERVVSKPQLS